MSYKDQKTPQNSFAFVIQILGIKVMKTIIKIFGVMNIMLYNVYGMEYWIEFISHYTVNTTEI